MFFLCSLFGLSAPDIFQRVGRRGGRGGGCADQAVGGFLDGGLDAAEEFGTRKAGRDGVEDLDDDGARVAQNLSTGPVEARVKGYGVADQTQAFVQRDVSRLVVGLGGGRAARGLVKCEDRVYERCAVEDCGGGV